ncbi:histone-like nucleoid-structuring protein, MvaT/MvaU family [Pseudomonas luteola]
MSILNDFRSVEAQIRELELQREKLAQDPRVQRDIDLQNKIKEILAEHDLQPSYLLNLFGLGGERSVGNNTRASNVRRMRRVKVYTNPNTGEVIETKGGNHKVLKQWKEHHGGETVESWATVANA